MNDEWRDPFHGAESKHEDRLSKAFALVETGSSVEHSASTLWSHLVGTFRILEAWGAPKDVCLAGLLHSIYSTQYFKSALIADRRRRQVSQQVGKRAEQLAYWFCVLDRESIRIAKHGKPGSKGHSVVRMHSTGEILRVSNSALRRLRLIDAANEIEQQLNHIQCTSICLAPLCSTFRSIGFLPSHLPSFSALRVNEENETDLRSNYDASVVARDDSSKRQLLHRCIELNSHCAEAKLLLAALELQNSSWATALIHARSGLRDLRGWGFAWDNRVPSEAWELMGKQLLEHAIASMNKLPDLALQILASLSNSIVHATRC